MRILALELLEAIREPIFMGTKFGFKDFFYSIRWSSDLFLGINAYLYELDSWIGEGVVTESYRITRTRREGRLARGLGNIFLNGLASLKYRSLLS